MAVCLRLPNPLDDRLPILSSMDSKSRLRQLELVILPPFTPILDLAPLLVAKFFRLALKFRRASVPAVFSEQQDSDGMRGSRGLECVLRTVVDQNLRVDLLANLNASRLGRR